MTPARSEIRDLVDTYLERHPTERAPAWQDCWRPSTKRMIRRAARRCLGTSRAAPS